MLQELDEMLASISQIEEGVCLALPAQVICDWHADWSDLTENTDYSHFPMWHTKHGKDGGGSDRKHVDEDKKTTKEAKDGKKVSKNRSLRRKSTMVGHEEEIQSPHKSDKDPSVAKSPQRLLHRTRRVSNASSKLDIVSTIGKRQPSVMGSVAGRRMSIAKSIISPTLNQHVPVPTSSRMGAAPAQSNFQLNYQLSSKVYRDKGWTVLHIEQEETNFKVEKRILSRLAASMQSM